MSSIDRSKEYAKAKGPKGFSTSENIDYWSKRAEKNSELAPRAQRKMELPLTGKKMELRDTSMRTYEHRKADRKMRGD